MLRLLADKIPYDDYTREFVWSSHREPVEKFRERMLRHEAEVEERYRKIEYEERLACIQATAVMDEMLNGTCPSMIHSRLKARK